jgi:predicted nucleic acid-binding protein
MLDTNVAIDLRDGDPGVTAAVAGLGVLPLLSIVTRAELEGGVYRQADQIGARRARLDAILAVLPVAPFDEAAADVCRTIVEAAGYSRRKLLDRTIGAQAIVHHATLVTRNAADFQDIPGLLVEAWP